VIIDPSVWHSNQTVTFEFASKRPLRGKLLKDTQIPSIIWRSQATDGVLQYKHCSHKRAPARTKTHLHLTLHLIIISKHTKKHAIAPAKGPARKTFAGKTSRSYKQLPGRRSAPATGGVKKPHCYHPGTVSLCEICHCQKSVDLMFPTVIPKDIQLVCCIKGEIHCQAVPTCTNPSMAGKPVLM
jgi:hypothetical protein